MGSWKYSKSVTALQNNDPPLLCFFRYLLAAQELGLRSPMPIQLLALLLPALLSFATSGVAGDAYVTGAVFCDQCRDGQRNFFDYPLYGAKISVSCSGGVSGVTIYGEATTNYFGEYCLQFAGEPDLGFCSVQLINGTETCSEIAGQGGALHLQLGLFGMGIYTADDLLAMPSQPSSSCSPFSFPEKQAPESSSACSPRKWAAPIYRCYWKKVLPGTKVEKAFGKTAGHHYGGEMTLLEALHGRGDVYRTLLREATTALLNSYHSEIFLYPTISVISHMNRALSATPQQALEVALRFKRANSGARGYSVVCTFSPCL